MTGEIASFPIHPAERRSFTKNYGQIQNNPNKLSIKVRLIKKTFETIRLLKRIW